MSAHVVRAVLDGLNPVWVDPPVLQPAGLYLELAGEDIRRRAFLLEGEDGAELCLRPDMTVPALRAVAAPAPRPGLIAYDGMVFRRQPASSAKETEFVQIGAEWIGADQDEPATDLAVINTALEACRASGVEPLARFGDAALVRDLVAAQGFGPGWTATLTRAALGPAGLDAALADADAPLDRGLLGALAQLPRAEAEGAVAELIAARGAALTGTRTVADVTARLLAKAARADEPPPPASQITALKSALALSGPPEDVFAGLAALPHPAPGPLEGAISTAAARWRGLHEPPSAAVFEVGFARGLGYYTGFVLELEALERGPLGSLGGGGRYDGLADLLGGAPTGAAPAAGFALRPARLARAQGGHR